MSQVHPLARTTPRTRTEIRSSSAPLTALAERYNITLATARATGCFAPVDSPLCALDGAASYPQASPVDNPAPAACQVRKTET